MLTEIEKVLPSEIEKRSFEIIAEELGDKQLIPGTESIVKRCIHTSADFDYADNLIFSENVVEKALKAIRGGASIVTDTQMGKAGINKKCLAGYGGEVYCFMSDDDVAQAAKRPSTNTMLLPSTPLSKSKRKAAKSHQKNKKSSLVTSAGVVYLKPLTSTMRRGRTNTLS